jgi:hypothetical protein
MRLNRIELISTYDGKTKAHLHKTYGFWSMKTHQKTPMRFKEPAQKRNAKYEV